MQNGRTLLLQYLLHAAVGTLHNVEAGLGDSVYAHTADGVDASGLCLSSLSTVDA